MHRRKRVKYRPLNQQCCIRGDEKSNLGRSLLSWLARCAVWIVRISYVESYCADQSPPSHAHLRFVKCRKSLVIGKLPDDPLVNK
jgi:hypothetical protein